jgi:hypothetical protein
MRLYIAILFSICIANAGCSGANSNSKGVIHDTIFVEKKPEGQYENKLIGTTVLKSSEKNHSTGYSTGLWLENLTTSECGAPMEHPTPTQITSIKQPNDSTLVIKALIDANCSYDFLGEVEVLNGNTLNLLYHGYGGYAQCNCEFELTYTFEVSSEGLNIPDKIKFVTVDGASKTSLPKIRIPRTE